MKIGDKLVCVDNERCQGITIGKIYTVIEIDVANDPCVINDYGRGYYIKERFISLKKYRKDKLEKLCTVSNI